LTEKWDIFCKIVDNFGDVGVCWRLSRQLSTEYDLQVRLWIDDLAIAKKLIPDLDIGKARQYTQNIEIRHWNEGTEALSAGDFEIAEVVIEAFACELPTSYIRAMQEKKPLWINLEYLSAEAWIDDFHAQSSIHSVNGLKKYFVFPGFSEKTGGLFREQKLLPKRDDFLTSSQSIQSFWKSLGVDVNNAIGVSLFCYPHAPINSLLECMQRSSKPVLCLIPEGSIVNSIASYFGKNNIKIGEKLTIGNLTVQIIPFLSQPLYDQLLWACDINFVRGEDSWLRAIWAGRPFIWQPYYQQEDAHITKLESFIEHYYRHEPAESHTEIKNIMRACHLNWSGQAFQSQHWEVLLQNLTALQSYHLQQSRQLAQQPDFAAKLVNFCRNRL